MSANALENATSPYLLLHKDNPVRWRLWGSEALAEAKDTGKPILLSMGYTACHWCHVMNEESFSDMETAALINDLYIPILADREERPDLDNIYQTAAGIMGHQGGWPLNIFLKPDGMPYFVAGYLPREERQGQPAFKRVLTDTGNLFRDQSEQVANASAAILGQLSTIYDRDMRTPAENIALDMAAIRMAQRFDIFFGGIQQAQKFPNPTALEVLWRAFLRSGAPQYSQLVFTTLDHVLLGGISDHVGGGFFRYAMDERWMLPHFEKMLYDNALMIDILTQTWQFNRNAISRQRVADTVGWLLREMKVGDGFAAGLDSDTDGEEGKYYLWSEAEIDAALMGTFSARFKQVYGVTRDGNHNGRTVLRRLGNPAPAGDADEALIAKQLSMLLAARGKRQAPRRDDKLLADWNGLTIAALANAGMVFERADWIDAAIGAFDYVVKSLGDGERLHHSFAGGKRGASGFSDDYANMARAALQLLEVTGDQRFLEPAIQWVRTLNDFFWDEARGGYCYTASDAEKLIVRPRTVTDSPAPSANGTMLVVLTRLAILTGEGAYGQRANALVQAMGDELNRVLVSTGAYLNGVEYYGSALQILVIGHKGNARTQELLRTIWGKALPNRLVTQIEPGDPLPPGHGATGQGMQAGQPTAYILQRGMCSTPITSAVALSQALTLPPQQRPVAANG
jgi:uncharacterized protein YyaL (SSP411 family)